MSRTAALFLLPLVLTARPAAGQQTTDHDLQRRITPIVEVVRAARPAVAFIQSDVPYQRRDWLGRVMLERQVKSGSGFVIEPDGYIVTNYHVVSGAHHILVSFDDEDDPHKYEAKLLSQSEENDLALLKIDGRDDFPYLQPGTNDPLLGETVIAIGNPYGQTHTVSSGIISGLHRNVEAEGLHFTNLIQTDASINPGNSGGPLLNINGELVGINTAMNANAENIGFAIPVDQLTRVLNETLLSLDRAHAWLGFDLGKAPDFRVDSVVPGSPAAAVGLEPGDQLLALGGRKLTSDEDYRLAMIAVQPLDDVPLEIRRDGKEQALHAKAWEVLDGYLWRRMGMSLEGTRLGAGLRPYLVVTAVQDGGPASALGLHKGDVVEAVRSVSSSAPRRVVTREQLAWVVSSLKPDTDVELYVMQDRNHDGRFQLDEGEGQERFKGEMTLR